MRDRCRAGAVAVKSSFEGLMPTLLQLLQRTGQSSNTAVEINVCAVQCAAQPGRAKSIISVAPGSVAHVVSSDRLTSDNVCVIHALL